MWEIFVKGTYMNLIYLIYLVYLIYCIYLIYNTLPYGKGYELN